MKDQAGPLLGAKMGVNARSQVRFRTPQFHLIWMHVASPGLMRLCRSEWNRFDAAEHLPVGGCATSPAEKPPRRSRNYPAGCRVTQDPSKRPECTRGGHPAKPAPDEVDPCALACRILRGPCLPARGADCWTSLDRESLGGGKCVVGFFDRVQHDVFMVRVARRVKDKRVLGLPNPDRKSTRLKSS